MYKARACTLYVFLLVRILGSGTVTADRSTRCTTVLTKRFADPHSHADITLVCMGRATGLPPVFCEIISVDDSYFSSGKRNALHSIAQPKTQVK